MRLAEGLSYRDIVWKNSFELFLQRPFFGHGLGMFATKYISRFGMFSVEALDTVIAGLIYYGGTIRETALLSLLGGMRAHNIFLNYAVETGILGPLVLLWFYSVYFKWAFICLGRMSDSGGDRRAILIGVTAAVLGNFVHGFFEATTMFSMESTGVPFVAIIALAFAQTISKDDKAYSYGD
jgi:O-antigen ligase